MNSFAYSVKVSVLFQNFRIIDLPSQGNYCFRCRVYDSFGQAAIPTEILHKKDLLDLSPSGKCNGAFIQGDLFYSKSFYVHYIEEHISLNEGCTFYLNSYTKDIDLHVEFELVSLAAKEYASLTIYFLGIL